MTLVIYGPTVTGKTDLALTLAKKYKGEIISADSRQVYKYLDIGTGKLNFEQKFSKDQNYWLVNNIRIYGYDIVEPETSFTARDFLSFTEKTLVQIEQNKKLPIIVGGTALYIFSLFGKIDIDVPPNWKLRKKLELLSVENLSKKLKQLNSHNFDKLNESDRKNPRRLIRQIEITSAIKISRRIPFTLNNYQIIGTTAPNAYLFEKANIWLDKRLELGLVYEVENLIDKGISKEWLESLGLEYKWITRYINKEVSYEESIQNLRRDIHSLIRRQKTWFNKFPQITLFDISNKNYQKEIEKVIDLHN